MPKHRKIIAIALLTTVLMGGETDSTTDKSIGINAAIECTDFDLLGKLDDLLTFNFNIGPCSISSSGLEHTPESQAFILSESPFEKALREGKFVYSTTATIPTSSEQEKTKRREGKEKSMNIFSRELHYGEMGFMGGKDTVETEKKIVEAALAQNYPDADEQSQGYSTVASTEEKEDCKKDSTLSSMSCDFKSSLNLNSQRSKNSKEGYDRELNAKSATLKLATTESKSVFLISDEVKNDLPPDMREKYIQISTIEESAKTETYASMLAINNLRKDMSEILATKEAITSVSRYESVSRSETDAIQTEVLP
ncbi:MAG: hypothetical protein IE916_00230 [Epsilonproteobacteria bacterium]|nr:hypothetical protein [Campylobacterota bacterium]